MDPAPLPFDTGEGFLLSIISLLCVFKAAFCFSRHL